jgi:hypothetical protein
METVVKLKESNGTVVWNYKTLASVYLVGCMGAELLFWWKSKCDKNMMEFNMFKFFKSWINFGYVAYKSYYRILRVFLLLLVISVKDKYNKDIEKWLELLGLRPEKKIQDIS